MSNATDNPRIEVLKAGGSGVFTNYIYKAIPLAFDESMSYYETLAGLRDYLEETVIPTVNNNAEAVAELQGLYEELNKYVDDYFKNLDVQEEINNKLDDLVEDGTLTRLIGDYVDPYIAIQDRKIEQQTNNITSMQNEVNRLTIRVNNTLGITPIPVNSVSEMTNTSKIYLLLTDGHIYYYDNNQWNDGGLYQAMGVADESITINKLDETLQKAQNLIVPYIDRANFTLGKFIDFNNPEDIDSTNYGQLAVTDYVEIDPIFKTIVINFAHINIGRVSANFYDENRNYISNYNYISHLTSDLKVYAPIPSNAKYIRATVWRENINNADLLYYVNPLSNIYQEINDTNEDLSNLETRFDDYVDESQAKYIKDLRNVVDKTFDSADSNFQITDGAVLDTSNKVVNFTSYGKIIYNKWVEADICKNSIEFTLNAHSKLGVSIGKMMATLQSDINKLSLNNDYASTSTIPADTQSVTIPELTLGHRYCLELVKVAMTYYANLIDLNTLEKWTCTIQRLQNTGFGRSQMNFFSGDISVYNYKYFLPYYNDEAEIMFLGDSTTEGVDVQDLTKRWCYQLKTNYFKTRKCIINGVGGNRVYQALERMQRLINTGGYSNLKYCIIYLGLNGSISDYEEKMPEIITLCKNNNIIPIVAIPQRYSNAVQDLETKRDFAIAQKWDLIRFDLTSLTNLHPTDAQQPILEEYAIKSLDYLM